MVAFFGGCPFRQKYCLLFGSRIDPLGVGGGSSHDPEVSGGDEGTYLEGLEKEK